MTIAVDLGGKATKKNDGPLMPFEFPNFNGPFEIFMGLVQNLMDPRILNIHIRA